MQFIFSQQFDSRIIQLFLLFLTTFASTMSDMNVEIPVAHPGAPAGGRADRLAARAGGRGAGGRGAGGRGAGGRGAEGGGAVIVPQAAVAGGRGAGGRGAVIVPQAAIAAVVVPLVVAPPAVPPPVAGMAVV